MPFLTIPTSVLFLSVEKRCSQKDCKKQSIASFSAFATAKSNKIIRSHRGSRNSYLYLPSLLPMFSLKLFSNLPPELVSLLWFWATAEKQNSTKLSSGQSTLKEAIKKLRRPSHKNSWSLLPPSNKICILPRVCSASLFRCGKLCLIATSLK